MILHFISTALSPITHMHGVAGNVALLQREAVIGPDGQAYSVPCLSGNALRHALVRVSAARYLCDAVGLKDVPYQLGALLFHGGSLTKDTPLTAAQTKDLLDAVPFLALLGGALPGQILQGALKVSRGLLICSEAADIIARRSGVMPQNVGGSESYVGAFLYTRGAEENNPDAIGDRMIYEGECVKAGAKFYHTMTLEGAVSPLVTGCLLKALRDASKDIGGMGRIGHGELSIEWASEDIDDADKLIKDYEDFVTSTADAVRETLLGLFGGGTDAPAPKPKKAAKPKAAKAKADEPKAADSDGETRQARLQDACGDFFGEV